MRLCSSADLLLVTRRPESSTNGHVDRRKRGQAVNQTALPQPKMTSRDNNSPSRRLSLCRTAPILSIAALTVGVVAIFAGSNAHAANGSVSYGYDALGRLTTASYDTGVCIVYSYDANGNRLSQTVNIATGSTPTWGSGVWGCFKWTLR